MAKVGLQKALRLAAPEAKVVGSDVAVIDLHLSLQPKPVLHIGYAVGTVNADGVVTATGLIRTLALPLEDIAVKHAVIDAKLAAAAEDLVQAAYDLLVAEGAVGTGTRA